MSTEPHKNPDTTALADKLTTGWDQFKKGQLVSYRVMALILLVVTAIGLIIYIRSEQVVVASKAWLGLEVATTEADLKKVAEDHPNTATARIARLSLARHKLGPDGIEKLVTRDEAERKKAVENVEAARDELTKLADEFKDDPAFRAECYLGLANAEAALVGINQDGKIDEFRGSLPKVAEWLDKVAEVAEGTPWGADAKKLAASLKATPSPVAAEFQRVQTDLYNIARLPSLPSLPGGGQFPFGGDPHGGVFGGPGMPPISGLPGSPGR